MRQSLVRRICKAIGTIPVSSADMADQSVRAAAAAKTLWKRLGAIARGNLLYLTEAHAEELAQLPTEQMGKPITEA